MEDHDKQKLEGIGTERIWKARIEKVRKDTHIESLSVDSHF